MDIKQDLQNLIDSLKKGQSFTSNQTGKWQLVSRCKQYLRNLFGLEAGKLLALTAALIASFDTLEKVPVRFFERKQEEELMDYLLAGETILSEMEKLTSSLAIDQKNKLKRRLIGLKYRLELENGGLDQVEAQYDVINDLIKIAIAWKAKQAIIKDKELNEKEIKRLEELSCYAEAAELVLTDVNLQREFFKWAIRDGNSIAPFVEFPKMQEELVACNLHGRIGRMGGEGLKIIKKAQKELTLPIEGQPVNILDEKNVITFKGNYKLSIKEILEVFKNKKYQVGNLEYMAAGIINWNAHHLGYWDTKLQDYKRIDLNQHKWWQQLPNFEILSKEQAKQRYSYELDGISWNAAASATRGNANLDFDQTHAFMEIAIPCGKGQYAVYDFGKFAFIFPATFFENFFTFCHNVHATVSYPDENVYYSQRQHARYSFAINEIQGQKLMDNIKEDMLKSREKNFVFQIQSDNCAKWTHEKLSAAVGEEKIPNMFKMALLDTEPVGVIATLFKGIKKLPYFLQVPALTSLHLLLGATRQTKIYENGTWHIKSLTRHAFWQTGQVYLPAFLHKQLEAGHLPIYVNATLFSTPAHFVKESERALTKAYKLSLHASPSLIAGFHAHQAKIIKSLEKSLEKIKVEKNKILTSLAHPAKRKWKIDYHRTHRIKHTI